MGRRLGACQAAATYLSTCLCGDLPTMESLTLMRQWGAGPAGVPPLCVSCRVDLAARGLLALLSPACAQPCFEDQRGE